jgi:hypothetical protein
VCTIALSRGLVDVAREPGQCLGNRKKRSRRRIADSPDNARLVNADHPGAERGVPLIQTGHRMPGPLPGKRNVVGRQFTGERRRDPNDTIAPVQAVVGRSVDHHARPILRVAPLRIKQGLDDDDMSDAVQEQVLTG